MSSALFRSNLASFVVLKTASYDLFTLRLFSKSSSWMTEVGENWWFQDWIRPQAASTEDSVTDQRQAANCELSFKLFMSFRILASRIPRKCLVIFSCRSQVLSAFKQWNRQAFEGIVLAFRCSTHLNITLLSVYIIKSSLVRQLVSNCMHVLSSALFSGLRLFFGFLQVTFLSA